MVPFHHNTNIFHSHGAGDLADSFHSLQLEGCDNQSTSEEDTNDHVAFL